MADDLPLLANVNEILVRHYIFKFHCDFGKNCFTCHAVLLLEPVATPEMQTCTCFSTSSLKTNSEDLSSKDQLTFPIKNDSSSKSNFMLILDSHEIKVIDVSAIDDGYESLIYSNVDPSLINATDTLSFLTCEWSLKIWSRNRRCRFCFPKTVRISYETCTSGSSLLWVKDQDSKPAVFTYGAAINNRSLFPCQEPPIAMATWEALIIAPLLSTVLMSGDEEPVISCSEEFANFYYFTKKALPLSTLCLAIGYWEEHVITQRYELCPKCRIFSPSSLIDASVQEIFEYIPYCLKISEDVLGPYPFSRIDFLIVPPTFGSLGMASPNVIFLSQSLLVGDGSMCSRIAHEISHGWFGLLIGALDWNEEWLSEGFATFLEDHLHTWSTNMKSDDAKNYIELRSIIRRKTLMDEAKNTHEDLQILRPFEGVENKNTVDGVNATILKNGQNPIKGFIQVHYIKGYFLLKYLSDFVGIDFFMAFLCKYIKTYAGHLVTSKEFLTMYLDYFPNISKIVSMDSIYEQWLHNSNIPDIILKLSVSSENTLFRETTQETVKWKNLNNMFLKKNRKRKKLNSDNFLNLSAEQIILLLENLLELETFSTQALKHLNEVYHFSRANPEIQHRWYELVVMHKYENEYTALKKFLLNHLAMGVYLYSEMIFSTSDILQTIAKDCYKVLEPEMEPNFRASISQMIKESES